LFLLVPSCHSFSEWSVYSLQSLMHSYMFYLACHHIISLNQHTGHICQPLPLNGHNRVGWGSACWSCCWSWWPIGDRMLSSWRLGGLQHWVFENVQVLFFAILSDDHYLLMTFVLSTGVMEQSCFSMHPLVLLGLLWWSVWDVASIQGMCCPSVVPMSSH
jgi:hypothetical protein